MKNLTARLVILMIVAFAVTLVSMQSRQSSLVIVSYALAEKEAGKFDHTHSVFDSLLKKYVHNAKVDYKGFISSREEFNAYLKGLGSVTEDEYESWSQEEKLAFWINAYNAFTIKAIMDNYPIHRGFSLVSLFYPGNSIRQIDGVWDRLEFRAVGRMVTLNEIEHEILRKQFKEPRIHAAINCASIGCPDLRNEAYRSDIIEGQLDSASADFVNNSDKGVRINPAERTVKLSKIFKWFGDDFIEQYGNTSLFSDRSPKERAVLNFVMKYLKSEEEKQFLKRDDFKVGYLDYDWSLNELKVEATAFR